MKCEIIKDLLPSYIDGLTSNESNQEIETHLSDCDTCRKYYTEMKKDIKGIFPATDINEEKLIHKIKKNLFIYKLLLMLLPFLIIGLLCIIFNFIKFPVSINDNNIAALYELKNGDIYLEVTMPENSNQGRFSDYTSPENYEITRKAKVPPEANVVFYTTIWDMINSKGEKEPEKVWPAVVQRGSLINGGDFTQDFKGITYGREGKKEYKVIWEEGDPIRKAPSEIEEKAAKLYGHGGL